MYNYTVSYFYQAIGYNYEEISFSKVGLLQFEGIRTLLEITSVTKNQVL